MQKMERVFRVDEAGNNIGGGIGGEVSSSSGELASDLAAGTPSKDSTDVPATSSSVIPSKERAESFVDHSALGKDVFAIDEKGVLTVKGPENSDAMKGHLGCNLPLVPGVVQGSALISDAYIKGKTVSVEFGSKVLLPGHKVVICDKELHKYVDTGEYSDSTKVIHINLSDDEIVLPEDAYFKNINAQLADGYVTMSKEELDDYLLQEGAFRFMDGVTRQDVVQAGDEFFGQWRIPEDFPWTKDGKVDSAVLSESAAQMGSRFFSPFLNKGEKMRMGNNLNPHAKIVTLKSSAYKELKVPIQPGDTVYVYGKISQCSNATVTEKKAKKDEMKKPLKDLATDTDNVELQTKIKTLQAQMDAMHTASQFVYLMVNQKGEEVLKGELAGFAMDVNDLKKQIDRALAQLNLTM